MFKFGDRVEVDGLVPLQDQILRNGLRKVRKGTEPKNISDADAFTE